MKKLLILLTLISMQLNAATWESQGIILTCTNTSENMLYDFAEGIAENQDIIVKNNLSMDSYEAMLSKKLESFPKLLSIFKEEIKYIEDPERFKIVEYPLTNEVITDVKLFRICKNENEETMARLLSKHEGINLLVDAKYYDQLQNLEKYSLLVHYAIQRVYNRVYNYQQTLSKKQTRRITSMFFSSHSNNPTELESILISLNEKIQETDLEEIEQATVLLGKELALAPSHFSYTTMLNDPIVTLPNGKIIKLEINKDEYLPFQIIHQLRVIANNKDVDLTIELGGTAAGGAVLGGTLIYSIVTAITMKCKGYGNYVNNDCMDKLQRGLGASAIVGISVAAASGVSALVRKFLIPTIQNSIINKQIKMVTEAHSCTYALHCSDGEYRRLAKALKKVRKKHPNTTLKSLAKMTLKLANDNKFFRRKNKYLRYKKMIKLINKSL
jgi:hypothetical protein